MKEIFNNLTPISHLLPPLSQLTVEKIEGGFSNKTFLLKHNKVAKFIIRLPDLDKDCFLINREDERAILPLVTELGLSPPVLLLKEDGYMVSCFVKQTTFAWDIVHTNSDIKRIAEILKSIHRLEKAKKAYTLNVVIKHYIEQIYHHPDVDPLFQKQCDLLDRIAVFLSSKIPENKKCLCHNDLNPQNCLADPSKFWVIDWEYVGLGDPLFDLAVIKSSHNLTREQTVFLLNHYDSSLPVEQTLNTLEYYHALYLIREMTWMLLKYFIANDGSEDILFYYNCSKVLHEKLIFFRREYV